ncbi:unnamed protein product [Lasius platythorax]|uniref:Uncharacterized protein n=1 Tax=Lasius platythorax TaxID=488582 RepID=A0AAV2P8R3_9HYME
MSYEAGVIFIPKFITKTTTFPIEDEDLPSRSVEHRKSPRTQ